MLSARAVFGPGQVETPSGIVSSRPSDVFGDGMKNP